ncbi:MAG: hypothetical protein HY270_15985, partial [Deltaproteobacteria bacterium]|nr:hypothetical protein [Deltaproteobacteria bacterium]
MMRRNSLKFPLIVATVLVCARLAMAEGLYWESKTSGMGRERTAQSYAIPKMMKIVNSDGDVFILRAEQEKFIMLSSKRKTYREMTLSQLESAANAMQSQLATARGELE